MAAMPIYGKKHLKFSSPEPRKLLGWCIALMMQGLQSLFK